MPRKVAQVKECKTEDELKNESMQSLDDSLTQKTCSNKSKSQIDKENQKELRKQQFEEKQRQKMEEKNKKDQEKKQREEERKQKERDKELERKKKEIEKEEEKRKRDLEKKQKEIEKEIEKRKKEEERLLKEYEKEEEKRRREDERKKKEEEKRKEEEEKNKKLEKQRAILLGFLSKEKNDQENITCNLQNICGFKPIEVKKDMKMSAVERIKKQLVRSLADLSNRSQTYLEELSLCTAGKGFCPSTWSLRDPEVELLTSKRLKTKTLLFVENIRPPYVGTWRKKSAAITPLNPLAEDKSFFNYEYDSEQEWEYESGEDIASSDNEEDEELNEDPEDISFLVPHGYLSDGEDIIDLDPDEAISSPVKKKSMTNETKQILIDIREKQFQAELKQQVHQINPNITGPIFISQNDRGHGDDHDLFRMICRTGDAFPINCNLQSDLDCSSTNNSKIKSVPPEAVVHIIRLVHCNQMSRAKLCYEFRMFWEYSVSKRLPDVSYENDLLGRDWDEFSIGKKRFCEKLKEIAERKDGMWIVKPEVIQEYQLCCLNDDPEKPCTEKWKYVSEVINIDSKKIQKSKKRKAAPSESDPAVIEKSTKHDNDTEPLLEQGS